MLTNRKPMKRSGFKPRELAQVAPEDAEARNDARQERMAALMLVKVRKTAPMVISEEVVAVPKEDLVRSEPYRRLVASLPCIFCGIKGYSQHAHQNPGKGLSLKVDDRCAMPLCCTRPGVEGCHPKFDLYRLVPGGNEAHAELGRKWAAMTRHHLRCIGLWPPKVPHMPEDIEPRPDG